jgi:hypothetical protein
MINGRVFAKLEIRTQNYRHPEETAQDQQISGRNYSCLDY